jgi:hypothetical protein
MPQSWDMGQILSLPPPKEGMLRIFSCTEKIQRLRPGLNPQHANHQTTEAVYEYVLFLTKDNYASVFSRTNI